MGKIRYLWHRHRYGLIALVAAAILTMVFTLRFVTHFTYWSDERHLHQPPAPWMTPHYIARSWGLNPETVETALDAYAVTKGHPTLEAIAKARKVPLSVVMTEVEALLNASQQTQ